MARSLMRGRDRDKRESIDVVQSLATDLLSSESGILELDPEAQRKFLTVALRHRLARYARRDYALKRGGPSARNHAINAEMDVPSAANSPGPKTLVLRAEELRAVEEGLDVLDPESRTVLALYFSGVPYDAIAEALDTTDQNARQRFVRAKRDLVIVAMRAAREPWEEVSSAVGLDLDCVKRRHAALLGRPDSQ